MPPMTFARTTFLAVLVVPLSAVADPAVDGNTISWPDDGWYQVQNPSTYETLCEGGSHCDVPDGTYTVINHTTGQRFENIVVGSPSTSDNDFVFSRTDIDEFRWVSGDDNIWIDARCAEQLGGATQFGTWQDLNDIAPNFDAAANPCLTLPNLIGEDSAEGFVKQHDKVTTTVTGAHFVELISLTGDADLQVYGQNFQCGSAAGSEEADICPDGNENLDPEQSYTVEIYGFTESRFVVRSGLRHPGYVFARTDIEEYRWVRGSGNIWIEKECADYLGGPVMHGNWHELNQIAPQFDSIRNPCTELGLENAQYLSGPTTVNGQLESEQTATYIVTNFNHIALQPHDGDLDLTLYDQSGDIVCISINYGTEADTCPSFHGTEFDPGTVYLAEIRAYETSRYTLSLNFLHYGLVFLNTSDNQFYWVSGQGASEIDSDCAAELGGETLSGNQQMLASIAPLHDSIDPCGDQIEPRLVLYPDTETTVALSADEFRRFYAEDNVKGLRVLVSGGPASLYVQSSTADSVCSNRIAEPESPLDCLSSGVFEDATDDTIYQITINSFDFSGTTITFQPRSTLLPDDGFVFQRTDKPEWRYIMGADNIWIDEACATSLGGATQSGDWEDLVELSPRMDTLPNPCR